MMIEKKTPLRVKICGITTQKDATAAILAGADMLGFNFYSASPRYIDPVRCGEIIRELREKKINAMMVGVFVNADIASIIHTLDDCLLDMAQLSGDEPPDMLNNLEGRAYKVLRMVNNVELKELLQSYPARYLPPAYLVDASHPSKYGGTGKVADWSLAAQLARRLPILLAGGLTPENVSKAVARVSPWGVDVASGVESAPGIKDHDKIQSFIEQAHAGG